MASRGVLPAAVLLLEGHMGVHSLWNTRHKAFTSRPPLPSGPSPEAQALVPCNSVALLVFLKPLHITTLVSIIRPGQVRARTQKSLWTSVTFSVISNSRCRRCIVSL